MTDFIADDVAAQQLQVQRPFVYRRSWPRRASSNAYYSVSVYNPTNITHTFAHLSVILTPGWASNFALDRVNHALAAREPGVPSYTGQDAVLTANDHTHIRLDFPVPSSAPVGFKYIGLGILWGSHPSPDAHYYDVGRFYTMKF